MSTLREQLEKLSNDNLVSLDKLLDTEFVEEIDYDNLDEKIELKQHTDSLYNIFTKEKSTPDNENTSNDMLDMTQEIRNMKREIIKIQRIILGIILPILLLCIYYVISNLI